VAHAFAGAAQHHARGHIGLRRQHALAGRDLRHRLGPAGLHRDRIRLGHRVGVGRQHVAHLHLLRNNRQQRRGIGAGVGQQLRAYRPAVAQGDRSLRPCADHRHVDRQHAPGRGGERHLARGHRSDALDEGQGVAKRREPCDSLRRLGLRHHCRLSGQGPVQGQA
jgi:hypothetical protein